MKIENNNTVYLDDDAAFIIAQSHTVGARLATDAPHPLHPIVQSVLQSVGVGVPHSNGA